MPNKVYYRIWQLTGVTALVVIGIVFSIHTTYGLNLLGSFLNGEGSIGFWTRQGLSLTAALGIAIGCSSFDTFGWFLLFGWLRTVQPETIEHRWRLNLYLGLRWFGRKLGHVYVPNPTDAGIDPDRAPDRRYYLFLPLFGAYPGLIQIGVNYALNFKLRTRYAFPLLIGANVVKMIFFAVLSATFAVAINPIWPVLLFLVTAHRFKGRIERKIAAWSTPTPCSETLSAPSLSP